MLILGFFGKGGKDYPAGKQTWKYVKKHVGNVVKFTKSKKYINIFKSFSDAAATVDATSALKIAIFK